jgi:hypothetical protein
MRLTWRKPVCVERRTRKYFSLLDIVTTNSYFHDIFANFSKFVPYDFEEEKNCKYIKSKRSVRLMGSRGHGISVSWAHGLSCSRALGFMGSRGSRTLWALWAHGLLGLIASLGSWALGLMGYGSRARWALGLMGSLGSLGHSGSLGTQASGLIG